MEARNNKIVLAFIYFISNYFHTFSQQKQEVNKLELKGNVIYSFNMQKQTYQPSSITFENDTIKCLLINGCIEKIELLKRFKINELSKCNCDNIFDEDSTNNLEKSFAINRTPNYGGFCSITSPFYYKKLDNDSLKIVFEISGSFYFVENSELNSYNLPRSFLILDKIYYIDASKLDFLEENKYIKSNISKITYPIHEY
jgi:hypothetical protein